MNAKRIAGFIIGAAIAVSLAGLGYWRGKHDERVNYIQFNLVSSLHLYAAAGEGTPEKLKRDLGFLVYAYTQEYKKYIAEDAVPPDFRERFTEAKRISRQVETNLVVLKP